MYVYMVGAPGVQKTFLADMHARPPRGVKRPLTGEKEDDDEQNEQKLRLQLSELRHTAAVAPPSGNQLLQCRVL